MKIANIAHIRSGYQFRGKVVPDLAGEYRVVQMSDIDGDRRLRSDSLVTISPETAVNSYLVDAGDVLFLSRGRRPMAVAVTEPLGNAIAAGYFFILRLKVDGVLPEYLAWYLNQPPAQARLRSLQRGTHMPIVSKADLQELEVELPHMAVQRKVVELERLALRERQLTAAIQEKRTQLAQAVALRAVRESAQSERSPS